jgi:hypothetical protein
LEQSEREADRDRRPLTRLAPDVERPATNLGSLAHHRHPEVALGPWSGGVEADAVVCQLEFDLVLDLADRDPDLRRLRVFQCVHHALAGDVEHEEGDRRRQVDVLNVAMEGDTRVAADLIRERLEGFGETASAEWRPVQVADQGADPVGRLLFGLSDLLELLADLGDVALLKELAGDIDLDREAEQDLRQVVVEVSGDL